MIPVSPLVEVLRTLRPGAKFCVHGEGETARIEWLDTVQTKPPRNEIDAALAVYVPPQPTDIEKVLTVTGLSQSRLRSALQTVLQ